MKEHEVLIATRREVQRRLAGQGAGHGMDHVERVVHVARTIQAEVGGDRFVVELAALLHELGDAKFYGGVERSGEFAAEILAAFAVSDDVIKHIVRIVENIPFRKRDSAATLSLEGQIVQDADRLDALGAIGIVRTIEYGASINQPFFEPAETNKKSGVAHFYDKLFKLRELMNTDVGRRLATEREAFMREFLSQFYSECGIEPPPSERE